MDETLKRAIDFLKQWEGIRLSAYQDGGKVWTIGYGATGTGIQKGLQWTKAQAEEDLQKRTEILQGQVREAIKAPATQSMHAALISFSYNVGVSAFKTSTLLKFLNIKKYFAAADQILLWNKDNGVVIPGLVNRRKAERILFLVDDLADLKA